MNTISEIFQMFDEGTGQVDVLQVAAIIRWMGDSDVGSWFLPHVHLFHLFSFIYFHSCSLFMFY